MSLASNLVELQKLIQRYQPSARLLAVTKLVDFEQVNKGLALGIKLIGENRVQAAAEKFPQLKFPCEKHLIGRLQTNKVKKALEIFDLIESVDSMKLAEKISAEALKMGKKMPVFLEVNLAKEESKAGFSLEELEAAWPKLQTLKGIEIRGLMTMPPWSEDPEHSRPYFKQLKQLADKLKLPEISMGTSQDFEVALQEGATIVRVGTRIFGNK